MTRRSRRTKRVGDDGKVRFDRGLVQEQLALAPSAFTLRARNPARNLTGGDKYGVRYHIFEPMDLPAESRHLDLYLAQYRYTDKNCQAYALGGYRARDAIAVVAPGGHHFGTAHTLARYETAFYPTMLSSRQNYESWQQAGSADTAVRANAIWKQLRRDYEQPPLDPAVDEALVDYVERRKRDIQRGG